MRYEERSSPLLSGGKSIRFRFGGGGFDFIEELNVVMNASFLVQYVQECVKHSCIIRRPPVRLADDVRRNRRNVVPLIQVKPVTPRHDDLASVVHLHDDNRVFGQRVRFSHQTLIFNYACLRVRVFLELLEPLDLDKDFVGTNVNRRILRLELFREHFRLAQCFLPAGILVGGGGRNCRPRWLLGSRGRGQSRLSTWDIGNYCVSLALLPAFGRGWRSPDILGGSLLRALEDVAVAFADVAFRLFRWIPPLK